MIKIQITMITTRQIILGSDSLMKYAKRDLRET